MKTAEQYLRDFGLICKDKELYEPFALDLTRDCHVHSVKTIVRMIEQIKKDSKCNGLYLVECEWDMPLAGGYFSTYEKAMDTIKKEDWSFVGYDSWEEVLEDGMVSIEEITVN